MDAAATAHGCGGDDGSDGWMWQRQREMDVAAMAVVTDGYSGDGCGGGDGWMRTSSRSLPFPPPRAMVS
uniref:Uncharacterized protein n=1 Tax=Oryza meridionalis TaxID=40149 RepID=A0A0E0CI63_9ORYZ